jgi:hypothetical protein
LYYAINVVLELRKDLYNNFVKMCYLLYKNTSLFQALKTISTLPFHLVNDLWRWEIFRNEVPVNEWNTLFWKLKNEYVGVEAPVERTSEDLDPPTLYYIKGGVDMIR